MTTTTIIITQKLENVLKNVDITFNHSIRYKVKAEVVHFDENGDGRVINIFTNNIYFTHIIPIYLSMKGELSWKRKYILNFTKLKNIG